MGGWFRKKIDTIADYRGLKMRMGTGLGGRVIARAGGTAVLTPAAEIYASLERGVIDAAEWVGPHDDLELGLQNTARYYYYPGWHEPGTVGEFVFNRKAYDALPLDLRRILDFATTAVQVHGFMDYHAKNLAAIERLRTQFSGKVELVEFPVPVLRDLKKLATDVEHEQAQQSPMARKVQASFAKFQQRIGPWDHVAQGAYHHFLKG
jgi:TRAP-type mannitol/chloroaromatic compound transport system substrate-binding protein